MNGAKFIRDMVHFMDHRKESLNEDKTVKQLIDEFMNTYPDPNDYDKYGRSCLGFNAGLPTSIQEALNSGDGAYRP